MNFRRNKKRDFCCNELQQSLATWAAMPGLSRTDDIADTENRASYSLMFHFIVSPGKSDCKLIFLYRNLNI